MTSSNWVPARTRAWLDGRGLDRVYAELTDDILRQGPQLLAASAAIDLPILLVRGGPASPLSDTDVNRFRRANPSATVARVPAAGHLVARDAPDDLSRIIALAASTWLAG